MAQRSFGIGSWAGAPGQALIQISIALSGQASGGPQLDTWFNQYSPFYWTVVNLTTGDNTIAIPTQAGSLLVVMPTGNTHVVKFDGSSGVPIGKTGFLLMILDSPPSANFVLNAASGVNGVIVACE